MKKWFVNNKYTIWYTMCFLFLGIIDQRRGSATGPVQMVFANLTGVAVTTMLLPSLKKEFYRWKGFKSGAFVMLVVTVCACIIGDNYWEYAGQWYTAILNVALIGGLLLYIIWDRYEIFSENKISKGFFAMVMIMLLLMGVSVHEAKWSWCFLGLFGCFYLIGIPEHLKNNFLMSMPYGIVLWFFVQQTMAFGFRPYDYVRYKGLYSGETQNGLFYLIVFCAFLCLWLSRRKENKSKWIGVMYFLLAAGSVSFILITGGRSALVGAVAAGCVGLMGYDVICCKSFRHWLVQGIALGLCIVVLLPAVYGCVRYLPTILHHPIWFEGEYNADTSVHSYDSWDSERYVSFEEMIYNDIGRMLQMLGIVLKLEDGEIKIVSSLDLTVRAAEKIDPGSDPEHPFIVEGVNVTDAIDIRKVIYAYVARHLNFTGHSEESVGFYTNDEMYYEGHIHNMYLQVAYNYGILPGMMFCVINLWCLVCLLRRKDVVGVMLSVFLVGIMGYGLTEMATTFGQITLILMFVLYYWGMQNKENTECRNRIGEYRK